jgi:hypothetical protein
VGEVLTKGSGCSGERPPRAVATKGVVTQGSDDARAAVRKGSGDLGK